VQLPAFTLANSVCRGCPSRACKFLIVQLQRLRPVPAAFWGQAPKVRQCTHSASLDRGFPDGGEHEVQVRFFYGAKEHPGRPGPDEVFLNCPDGYKNLAQKVCAICRYARTLDLWDYVVKTADDTWLSIDLLKNLFSNPEDDYVGHCLDSRFTQPICPTSSKISFVFLQSASGDITKL
jgi:hypothetical protein